MKITALLSPSPKAAMVALNTRRQVNGSSDSQYEYDPDWDEEEEDEDEEGSEPLVRHSNYRFHFFPFVSLLSADAPNRIRWSPKMELMICYRSPI